MTTETMLWIVLYIIFSIWVAWKSTKGSEKCVGVTILWFVCFIFAPALFLGLVFTQIGKIFTKDWINL